jgi:uncharacterized LabA/DUF88 family protein
MRIRRIAVLIDGGFFLKRLPKLVEARYCTTPLQVAEAARHLCKRHVQRIAHSSDASNSEIIWLDHVYRLFYYDAEPYDGVSHHPILNRQIEFGKTETADFRRDLFTELRRKRKFALRLGKVTKMCDWRLAPRITPQVRRVERWIKQLKATVGNEVATAQIDEIQLREWQQIIRAWQEIREHDVNLELRQKGVDMRIGLDIASMTLKRQVDTIVLVTGDSDFVPAAKLARREGVEFLLDPLWQQVSDDLSEHVDGVTSVFPRPVIEEPALIAA